MKKMSVGDLVFVYHSGKEKQIVGVGKVIAFAHPDSTDDTGVWECVDIAPVEELKKTVSLTEVKYISVCHSMVLLKKSRLSVQPVTKKEWEAIVNF
jgi:predicted RNA-binding protein with PUA-like domain